MKSPVRRLPEYGFGTYACSCQLAEPSGDLLLDLQRKVLTPNDFDGLEQLERTIADFQGLYEKAAKPFEWKFSREDLKNVLAKFNRLFFNRKWPRKNTSPNL